MNSWDPERPHEDLGLLPPNRDVETRAVLKATVAARAALAQLDQAAELIPNPTVLINTIPLLEAQASSEIENIVTTADELFRHADSDGTSGDPATRETLRYRTALRDGFEKARARGVSTNTAADVCSIIKGRQMAVRSSPGTRIANPSTRRITYSPPEGLDNLLARLKNWEEFTHALDDMDPLVRMAVAHYQFEAIHPFEDGNGRTGRILNILMLVESGLLHEPLLYMSRYIIETKNEYYRLLLEVTRDEAWEAWILYMLEGVRQTALSTTRKIGAIRELQGRFQDAAKAAAKSGANVDFLSVMFEQPYCRISYVVERCAVSRPTAVSWLEAMVAAGLLRDVKFGRDRLFLNQSFFDILVRDEGVQPHLQQSALF